MKLYNTLSKQVETLVPLSDAHVKIYTCGLTVYSHPHIGNWLGYVYWDVLVRTLLMEGYTVERTQNITDVGHLTSDDDNGEDKMEKGAKREGITAWDVAEKYIAIANTESSLLNLTPPDHLIRATAMIQQQIAFAEQLDEKGFLYRIEGDGMYFDTSKLSDYGTLGRLDVRGLEAGARVSVEGKRTITDFAVWKFSPQEKQRDMEWDSPWGIGFPGWHLECSVIARETLGDQIDIHTGGIDHIPVHHTNEIAQTEAITGKFFSQIWLHVNHIKSNGQKMSKSLGNIYTLQDIIERGYDIDAFKVFVLQKHYRTEGNFTWDNLDAAQNRLNKWKQFTALRWQLPQHAGDAEEAPSTVLAEEIDEFMRNDLNTPAVLHSIDKLFDSVEQLLKTGAAVDLQSFDSFVRKIDALLGLSLTVVSDITPEQKQLLAEREQARAQNDWLQSDKLRDRLVDQGIGLRDTPNGALWYLL